MFLKFGLKTKIFEIKKMLQWGTPYDLEIYKGWLEYFDKKINKPLKNPPLDMTLVLPMAGDGARFKREGYNIPKPLLPIDGKEMIISAVNCLPNFSNISFLCKKEHLDDYGVDKILKQNYKKCNIIPIEKLTEGQACTCNIAISKLNQEKPIMISSCDNGIYYDENKYLEILKNLSIDVIVFSFRNNQASKNNPNMYSWLKTDANDNILEVSSKKFIGIDPLIEHAIIGTFFFRKAKYFTEGFLKNYKNNIRTQNEFYVDDVISQNINNGLKVKVFEVENYICWGTPNDYKTYNYWEEHFTREKNDRSA